MIESFKGKVVFITGAASGIGAASATKFAELGAEVIMTDVDVAGGEKMQEDIVNKGGKAHFMSLDVSNYEEVDKVISATKSNFTKIDVCVNNAGIAHDELIITADYPLEVWDKIIRVNQESMFYCMRRMLKLMHTQKNGVIVNIASLAGLIPSGYNIAYSASKFAVVGMTKSAALEYADKGIRINAVCPSYTRSALLEKVLKDKPSLEEHFLKMIPMKRFAEAEEIADSILWLSSDKSKYITGQCLVLDGGLSLK